MKLKPIITIILAVAGTTLSAQLSVNQILESVETNNTTLAALRAGLEQQKLENKTGIYLANPEVSFNYLWGSPTSIGRRTDVAVTQTFDIPTLTGLKSRVADDQNQLAELQYLAERMNILLETKKLCIDMIYYNALKKEWDVRLGHARRMAAAYREKFDRGDVGILENNKARLNLSAAETEAARIETEQQALLSELKRLNGGAALALENTDYDESILPPDFEQWYVQAEQKNPVLSFVRQEIELGKKQVNLNKAAGLPVFSAGYMSEKVVGQQYQGMMLGISIPLWENKNRVRQAKAAVRVAELREASGKQQFYDHLQSLYERAAGLYRIAEKSRKSLNELNHTELLQKTLDAGEISLPDYLVALGLYYDMVSRTFEAERDFQKALAELSATEI